MQVSHNFCNTCWGHFVWPAWTGWLTGSAIISWAVCLTFLSGKWQVSPGTLLLTVNNIQGFWKLMQTFSLKLNIWCAVYCNFNLRSFLYNYGGVTVLPISPKIFTCWKFNLLLWDWFSRYMYLLENLLKCITKSRQHAWKNDTISISTMEQCLI